jgi:DNA invertase Pin-like site-specific DNA recombinase
MNQPVAHIYVRVSDLNGRRGESLYTVDDQEEKARELATQRGYQVGEVVQDLDVSGGKTAADRGLGPLIESCERGEASAVIVWAFDRFSREHPWEVAESLNRLRKSGARLLAVSDGFDSDSEMGVMAASMLSIGAHAYRERMKKSWAMVQKRSLKRGAYPGKTPWGYTRTEEDDDGKPCGPLGVDDSLVEVIRELFQRRAEGAGINGLCDWLVSKGVRSPRGSRAGFIPPCPRSSRVVATSANSSSGNSSSTIPILQS